MSAPASGPFWRAAGMSYLKYANICADMMRGVMKVCCAAVRGPAVQRPLSSRGTGWLPQLPSGRGRGAAAPACGGAFDQVSFRGPRSGDLLWHFAGPQLLTQIAPPPQPRNPPIPGALQVQGGAAVVDLLPLLKVCRRQAVGAG
jgi:hypothetical protein